MFKDPAGRVVLPIDVPGESWKVDLTRTYCMVTLACPSTSTGLRAGSVPLPLRELIRMLLSNIRFHMQYSVSVLAGILKTC